MKSLIILAAIGCVLVVAVISLGPSAEETDPPAAADEGVTVAVAPVLHFKAGSKIEVQIDFENTSEGTFRYLLGHHGLGENGGLAHLRFLLYKDGRFVEPLVTEEPPRLAKDRIRGLKPGERAPHLLRIWNLYGDLKPGSYEIIARYEVTPGSTLDTEYGMTPLSLDRKVAYLEIE